MQRELHVASWAMFTPASAREGQPCEGFTLFLVGFLVLFLVYDADADRPGV